MIIFYGLHYFSLGFYIYIHCYALLLLLLFSYYAFRSIRIATIRQHINTANYHHILFLNICCSSYYHIKHLVGSLKDLKRQGQDITKHKQAISNADMSKLYDSGVFSDENPVALQRKVFVELMLQFGRRGREGLRSMRKDSFLIKTDGRGRCYVTLGFNELTKNHQNNRMGENEEEQLMLEQDHRCPVASFEKYLNKLHPACNDFWQRPSPSFLKKSGSRINPWVWTLCTIWWESCQCRRE